MKLVVISNQAQHEAFLKQGHLADDFRIFSDNPAFTDYLKSKKVAFELIDEFFLEPDWNRVNAAATSMVNQWDQQARERRFFSGVNWISVIYLFLTYISVQIIKNKLLAEKLVATYQPSEVLLFNSSKVKTFPLFSGNTFLNRFLLEIAVQNNISHMTIHYDTEAGGNETTATVARGSFFKSLLRKCAEPIVKMWGGSKLNPPDIFAYGSLKHLKELTQRLNAQGLNVAFFDLELNWEQFLFCLKNGMRYHLPETFRGQHTHNEVRNWIADQFLEIEKAFKSARDSSLFVYGDYDYGNILYDYVISGMPLYLEKIAKESFLYEHFLNQYTSASWLLDEDFGLKRSFLAAYLKSEKKICFCVSHANLAVDFFIPEHLRLFDKSITLVHSQHEKDMYSSRGWNPAAIVVTGSPRYDAIHAAAQRHLTQPKPRLKLLFVAARIWPSDPDIPGYLGCHITASGDFQVPAFKFTLEAIRGLPVDLIIKPHSMESVASWKSFAAPFQTSHSLTVTEHSADFLDLLKSSDGVVFSYWSTALIEAALLRKPAFFVAARPLNSPALEQFAEDGYCQIFHNTASLTQALTRLHAVGSHEYALSIDRKRTDYYLGFQEGGNTERAANFIRKMSSGSEKDFSVAVLGKGNDEDRY